MAAAAKNSEPMIALSRALTGKASDSKPLISAGKSQQAVPATAKTTARISLIDIPTPPYFHPTFRQARGNKVHAALPKLAAIASAKVHECTEAPNFGSKRN
jgi:hypothetical protein